MIKPVRIVFTGVFFLLLSMQVLYAGEYRKHSNAAISGHNVEQLSGVSVKQCKKACSSRKWCKSFDYYKDGAKCDLSNKHQQDVGGLKTNYSGNPYDHYHRKTYRKISNAAISGHNTEQLSGASVSKCKKACNDRSWCKSFDYYKNKAKCDLSNKSRSQVGLKKNYKGNPYDHYAKQ